MALGGRRQGIRTIITTGYLHVCAIGFVFFFKKIPPSISVFLGNCFFPCNPSVFTLQKRKASYNLGQKEM